jgi:hypothetical protein
MKASLTVHVVEIVRGVLGHDMVPVAVTSPISSCGSLGETMNMQRPFQLVLMALDSFCWVTRAFLLVHIGERLSAIVDNLVGSLE